MAEITLAGGQVARIDDGDQILLGARRWYILNCGKLQYARTPLDRNRQVLMHRLLLPKAPPDMDIDHVDGDGLNNRRANLRIVTRAENLWNRHNGLEQDGVSYASRPSKWRVTICHRGEQIDGGYYQDEATALMARAYLSHKLRGTAAPSDFDYLQLNPASRKFLFETTGSIT